VNSRLSKLLALYLRHRPEEAGLQIDTQGFVRLDEMLRAVQERYPVAQEGDIRRLVEEAQAPRFEIGERGIRALYGHSFFVELDGEPMAAPQLLYMGCLRKEVARFRAEGIKPVDRYYVHLSLSREAAAERSHQPGDPCVIEILAAQAQAAGQQFHKRGEVILTGQVSAQFVGEAHDVELPEGARRAPQEGERRERRPGDHRPPTASPSRSASAAQASEPAFGRRPRKATGRR